MTPFLAHIILGLCVALVLIPGAIAFIQDMQIMQLKGEAVARGHASVRDGVWRWNDIYTPDWDLGFGRTTVIGYRGLPDVEFTFHSPITPESA